MELDRLALGIHDQAVLLLLDLQGGAEERQILERLTTILDMCSSAWDVVHLGRSSTVALKPLDRSILTDACGKCLLDRYRPNRPEVPRSQSGECCEGETKKAG